MMTPTPEGAILSQTPVLLPIMAPRLQADCSPDGWADLALWGTGSLGRVRFSPLAAPYLYGPNRVLAANGGVHVAQTAPVMLIRGARLQSCHPARRCAWWHDATTDAAGNRVVRTGARRVVETGWGVVIVLSEGEDLRIAVGTTVEEAERGLLLDAAAIIAEAEAYAARCDLAPAADPLLRSMVIQGIHAALSSIRQDEKGAFAGLAAGQAYSAPARTYFRDGYWTLQPLLTLAPETVRDEIRLLATGLQPDGEAPSGVLLTGDAQSSAWRRFLADPKGPPGRFPDHHRHPNDWWSDHFDSPLFFVLALGDYARTTGDLAEVARHWPMVATILKRYFAFAGPDSVLPLKPRNDRDWADNVFRAGLVSYNIGLFVGALDVAVEFGGPHDQALVDKARQMAAAARAEIDGKLFVPARDGYADYATPEGFVEDHLVIDSLTLTRYGAITPERAKALLGAMQQQLESRHNSEQPYGDWGVLCAYPPYKQPKDLRGKTAFPFRYHNGSDWPYWSGVYAEQRLQYGLGGARYALTRWWQTCLENGWAGAVEYFSPPYGRGSLLQGWSAMPAAVVVKYGLDAVNAEPAS
ncbi:glycogen debranching protein [Oryzibacter oryziterrae]|uniref:glycogen debranching protein n=1 Tax=Oryzibacter oryziterrae TaxID=2766474 RepID=UPI001F42C381|nr:glycogen debranching protein [Oryzibacter oryziterrae]